MSNIILPKVQILDTISDNAKVLIEENGEINRFAVTNLGSDADTLGGHPIDDFVQVETFENYVESIGTSIKPKAGFIYPLAGSVIPEGFLLCDGAEYGRTEFPELFAAIGTIYGNGDGSTTFNVPNLQTRVPVGAGNSYGLGATGGEATHTLTADEMPEHSGHLYGTAGNVNGKGNATGAWLDTMKVNSSHTVSYGWDYSNNEYYPANHELGGSQPHNNMQPYTVVNYIIATGKDTGVSVSDIIMGAQAIPLGVEYGGTGATNVADVRKKFGIGVRNLLDNSYFTNPVNQRGLNSYSGLFANCIDRWLIYQISGQAYIHIENGYIRLVPGKSLHDWALMQDFPVGTFTAGTYTLAYCDVDGNITINNNPIYEDNDLYSGEVVQRVKLYGTEETCLKWAALYEGEYTVETLPEYQPKSYAEEIVACNLGETGNVTGTELLWRNASPTSEFATNGIMSGWNAEYSEYRLICYSSTTSQVVIPPVCFKPGERVVAGIAWGDDGNIRSRSFDSTATSVTSRIAYASKTADNKSIIPWELYGIKGVSA